MTLERDPRSATPEDRDPAIDEANGFTLRLLGRRVRVESAHGHRFEGYLDRLLLPEQHVFLRDVRDLPGEAQFPSAFVPHVDWIVSVSEEIRITEVDPAEVQSSPFDVSEFEPAEHSPAIQATASRGFVGRFPVVTERTGTLVVVDGHKRVWLAEQACLDRQPVVLESLALKEHAARFAFAHFPLPHDLDTDEQRSSRFYTDAELRESITILLDELGDAALDIYPVDFNAHRLGIDDYDIAQPM